MPPRIIRPIANSDWHLIEDLSPATLEGVADRLIAARTFEELVYRESEMDALFTLADIALHTQRKSPSAMVDNAEVEVTSAQDLAPVRKLIFTAHDLSHDGRVGDAAELLRQAARLLDGQNGQREQ